MHHLNEHNINYVHSDTSLPRSETVRGLGIILDTKLY